MKKILFILILVIFPIISNAEELSYNEAKELIKEVMADYYIKGPAFQYNYSKATYGKETPEDATFQDTKYMVCAGFVYDVHLEAFGIYNNNDNSFIMYNNSTLTTAREYYNKNKDIPEKMNGSFLVYYQNNTTNTKYIYGDSDNFEDFVNLVQPGDIVAYSGHSLIVYDIVTKEDGTKDVLLLNSSRSSRIYTPIAGTTSPLIYDSFPPVDNFAISIPLEGTIKAKYLSKESQFVDNNKINCKSDECLIIRTYYNDNGIAKFNYETQDFNISKSKLRLAYSGLSIEKTVDKGDNNSVNLNDELTYTIKITNNSNITKKNITYNNFSIEEIIDKKLEYISSNNEAFYKDNKLTWIIDSLKPGKTINLTYNVKVINDYNNLNNIISATGNLYSNDANIYISTGIVENEIVNNFKTKKQSYSICYDEFKNNYQSLELIDKVIECSTGENINLKEFDFNNIFTRKVLPTQRGTSNAIALKSQNEKSSEYISMILNNYWSGLVKYNMSNNEVLDFPRWNGNSAIMRNKTINVRDFKEGDVLIYTQTENKYDQENGLYAYIFINNEFIGINGSDSTQRNRFTFEYYKNLYTDSQLSSKLYKKYSDVKDNQELLEFINYQTLFGKENYVILRPEKIIIGIDKIELNKKPQLNYNVNDKDINVSDGTINITYSDGSTEEISLLNELINISGFDTSVAGTKLINIGYLGENTTFEILVNENEKQEENPPTGELNGIRIIVTMSIILLLSIVIIKYRKKEIHKI